MKIKLQQAVNQYLSQCKNVKKLEALTIKAYLIDLKQFTEFVAVSYSSEITISEVDKTVINGYIDFISAKYAAKSLKRKLASLKAFFNYLEFEDIITVTPFRKVKYFIKEPKRLPKALSLFDLEKIISHIYAKNSRSIFVGARNIAVFETLFATGVRVAELCHITMSDYDRNNHILRVRGKGNKERLIYIANEYVIRALTEYIALRGDKDIPYLFINRIGERLSEQSVRYFIEELGRRVLQKRVTPHMIRHTFATLLLEEGVDVIYIQNFLGHTSITTTQIYAASTTVKQRHIMTTFHPRNRIHILE